MDPFGYKYARICKTPSLERSQHLETHYYDSLSTPSKETQLSMEYSEKLCEELRYYENPLDIWKALSLLNSFPDAKNLSLKHKCLLLGLINIPYKDIRSQMKKLLFQTPHGKLLHEYLSNKLIPKIPIFSQPSTFSIFLFGITGVGKSTLFNLLNNQPLMLQKLKGKKVIETLSSQSSSPIYHSGYSGTSIPSMVSSSGCALIDCPGFEDNKGVEQEIRNFLMIKQIIQNSKRIKFVICIDNDSTTGRKNNLLIVLSTIANLMAGNLSLCKALLVVTKVPRGDSDEDLAERLENMANSLGEEEKIQVFLKYIVKTRRFLKFLKPAEQSSFQQELAVVRKKIWGALNRIPFFAMETRDFNFLTDRAKLQIGNQFSSSVYQILIDDLKRFCECLDKKIDKILAQIDQNRNKLESLLKKLDEFSFPYYLSFRDARKFIETINEICTKNDFQLINADIYNTRIIEFYSDLIPFEPCFLEEIDMYTLVHQPIQRTRKKIENEIVRIENELERQKQRDQVAARMRRELERIKKEKEIIKEEQRRREQEFERYRSQREERRSYCLLI